METLVKPEVYNRVVGIGVDFQNDFNHGTLPVGLEGGAGDASVAPFNRVGRWVRGQNGLMAFTGDWHPAKTNHFQEFGGPWPPHCVADTWGAQLVDDIEFVDGDTFLKKGTKEDEDAYSGFQAAAHGGLTLETLLYPTRGEHIAAIMGGWATDYCLEATVMDGLELAGRVKAANEGRQLDIYVISDAIAAVDVNPGDGERAIARMTAAGARFITSQALVNGEVIEVRS